MPAETTSNLWLLQTAGSIQWHLPFDAAGEVPIGPAPGWWLLTPVDCARMGGDYVDFVSHSADDLFVSSKLVVLRSAEPVPIQSVMQAGSTVLSLLRYISRQATVSRTVVSYSPRDPPPCDRDPRAVARPDAATGKVITRDYLVRNAITEVHLRRFANLPVSFAVPVHVELLLDALEAHIEQDYRKALLYAAMAVESFALDWLEAEHARSISQCEPRHRIIEVPVPGGVVRKDPVYDVLAAGNDFARLLHECPLYLINRSLLVEQPETYADRGQTSIS